MGLLVDSIMFIQNSVAAMQQKRQAVRLQALYTQAEGTRARRVIIAPTPKVEENRIIANGRCTSLFCFFCSTSPLITMLFV